MVSPIDENEVTKPIETMLSIYFEGMQKEVTVSNDKSLLASLLDKGMDIPYSCESGICGTCICTLISGKVQSNDQVALTKDNIKNNQILACQSRFLTSKGEVRFDS